jgi:hypothetical protein
MILIVVRVITIALGHLDVSYHVVIDILCRDLFIGIKLRHMLI